MSEVIKKIEKPQFTLTLPFVVVFPAAVAALELVQDGGKVHVVAHVGTTVTLATITPGAGKLSQDAFVAAAQSVFTYVTKKIAGSSAHPGLAPQGGMIHADNLPTSTTALFSQLQAAFPDYEFKLAMA